MFFEHGNLHFRRRLWQYPDTHRHGVAVILRRGFAINVARLPELLARGEREPAARSAACFSVRRRLYHEPTIFSVAVIPCPPIWMLRAFFETVVGEFSGALLCMVERGLPAAAEQRFSR
jgi:hypothetical protein